MRARLARRGCVRAGGGGRGRRAVRGVPDHRHRIRAGRERLGCPWPPPRLLGPPRSAPRSRLPRGLRTTPACRARGRAAPRSVRAVAASCRLHRPRATGTATPPPPGLDSAGNAVVRRGELGGELERAGYGAAWGGGSTPSPSAGPRSSAPPQGSSAVLTGAVGSTTSAGRRSRRCSSTTASATTACTPCPTAIATPGSGGACSPSTTPSPTSSASHSSTCWRCRALCWKRARSASSGTGGAGPGRGCRCNKHLGKCDHQIAPHEVRYQLHNVDSRTLLHCNCTRRLARCLHRARHCSDVDMAALADRIAMNCFVLELPAACSPGRGSQHSSCTMVTRAVLVPARQLKKILRRWGHLRVSSKAKHAHWKTHARGGTRCEQCQHVIVEQAPAWPHTVLR